jgi:PAS domain S-box-containing protein
VTGCLDFGLSLAITEREAGSRAGCIGSTGVFTLMMRLRPWVEQTVPGYIRPTEHTGPKMKTPFDWLSHAPQFDDPNRTRSAYVLHWILVSVTLAVGVQFVVATLVFDDPTTAWVYNSALGIALLASLYLLRAGYLRATALLVSASVWLAVTAHMITHGGMHSQALPGFVIATFLAGFTWSARAAIAVAAASAATIGCVAWAQLNGLLPAAALSSPVQVLMAISTCLVVTTIFVWLSDRSLHQAEAESRRSERKYAQLVENAPLGVLVVDRDHTFVQANAAIARIVGAESTSQFIGTSVEGTPMWKDPSAREGVLACLDRGETSNFEISGISRFGKPLRVRLYLAPLHDKDGTVRSCMIVCEDVASQRDMGEQLAQSHKLEALGRLAGGIAHDFNNLLTVVSGFSEAVHANLDDRPEDQEDLAQVVHAANRAAELTQQLLALSRKQVIQSTVFDLSAVLERLETMLRRLIGEDVELEMKLFERPALVDADEGQIEQVILNLVVNALDAMPSGGRLEISTRLDASRGGQPNEPHAVLLVEDSGIGMNPETLQKIFDPFFTTKEAGKGTGLGLATAYGIVQQCGGDLRVTSELGRGRDDPDRGGRVGRTRHRTCDHRGSRLPDAHGTEWCRCPRPRRRARESDRPAAHGCRDAEAWRRRALGRAARPQSETGRPIRIGPHGSSEPRRRPSAREHGLPRKALPLRRAARRSTRCPDHAAR